MFWEKKQAAIIGGGIMGGGIAAVFAAGGWSVHIAEPSPNSRKDLQGRFHSAMEKVRSNKQGEFFIYPAIEEIPWGKIEMAVECVPEKFELKQKVFARMEELSRAQIPLTSNSSGFPIGGIGKGLKTQNRMMGLHFFMPAHLAPLVEVIRSAATEPQLAKEVYTLMVELGKKPVLVGKDIPGFLANRIQHALMREALSLVEKGIASPEDVDDAVRYGFGFRYIAAGPLRQKDLTGLDTQYSAGVAIYPDLCNDSSPNVYIRKKVEAGHLGIKAKKGFYDWTPPQIEEFKAKYEMKLIKALKVMRDE